MLLLLSTLLKTYRKTWFSVAVLAIAIATGAIGLATVLNLSERAAQVQKIRPWYDYSQFNHITAKADQPLTIRDYRELKRQLDYPFIAIRDKSIPLHPNVKDKRAEDDAKVRLIGVDSLAAISALPFFNSEQQAEVTKLSSSQLFGNAVLMNSYTHESLKNATNPVLSDVVSTQQTTIDNNLADTLILSDISSVIRIETSSNHRINGEKNALKIDDIPLSALVFPGNVSAELVSDVRQTIADHLSMNTPDNRFAATQMSESFQLNLLALGLLMFAVCMFIVLNAGNLLLHKRMPMLLTLRQLGFSRDQIISVQFIELCCIALIVTMVATVISQTIDSSLAKQLTPIIGQSDLQTPIWMRFLQLAGVSIVGTILAFLPPVITLKRNLVASHQRKREFKRRYLFISSLIVCSLSITVLFTSSWLPLLLGSTAGFILGICGLLLVLLPVAVNQIKQVLRDKALSIALASSAADALTARTSLAFCAFFIAVTCNIGMNLMVDSFEQATQRWLDQRLIADAYVYTNDNTALEAFSSLKGTSVDIIPRLEDMQTFEDTPIVVYSYPSRTDYRDALSFEASSAQAWQQYETSSAVFVNQQFANIYGKAIGESIALITPVTNEITSYAIAGIYYDYGNPYGQVLMPLHAFAADSQTQVYALHFAPKLNESQLQQLAKSTGAQIFSANQLVALSMQAFNDTFLITNVLNLVTLLVAAIALACTILVLMEDTRKQQFLLKSLGFSSVQITIISINQYALLVIAGLILATPFGIAVSWILINIINLNAFQWQYPLLVQPWVLIKIYLLSISIVLLSIAIPIFSKSKRPISEELACID